MHSNISIITAEINTIIIEVLLKYQQIGKISNTDMSFALMEIAESFRRKDIINTIKGK